MGGQLAKIHNLINFDILFDFIGVVFREGYISGGERSFLMKLYLYSSFINCYNTRLRNLMVSNQVFLIGTFSVIKLQSLLTPYDAEC